MSINLPYIDELDSLEASWLTAEEKTFDPLPPGRYIGVVQPTYKKTNPQDGSIGQLIIENEFTVTQPGPYQGRKDWFTFFLESQNALGVFKSAIRKLDEQYVGQSISATVSFYLNEIYNRHVEIEVKDTIDTKGNVDQYGQPRRYHNLNIKNIYPRGIVPGLTDNPNSGLNF